VRLTTLPPSCAVIMKCGNLNFLEPSGPLLVYNGTTASLPPNLRLCNLAHITEIYVFVGIFNILLLKVH